MNIPDEVYVMITSDDIEPIQLNAEVFKYTFGEENEEAAKYISEHKYKADMEALRKACDDAFWKYEQTGPATISRAIRKATIEDKDDE